MNIACGVTMKYSGCIARSTLTETSKYKMRCSLHKACAEHICLKQQIGLLLLQGPDLLLLEKETNSTDHLCSYVSLFPASLSLTHLSFKEVTERGNCTVGHYHVTHLKIFVSFFLVFAGSVIFV